MKAPKPMLYADGNGKYGIVSAIESGILRERFAIRKEKHRGKWRMIVEFPALPDLSKVMRDESGWELSPRAVCKAIARLKEPSVDDMRILLKRIMAAQKIAARKILDRVTARAVPVPQALRRAALDAVFPEAKPTLPQWVARLVQTCGRQYGARYVAEWFVSGKDESEREMKRVLIEGIKGGSRRATNLFLFANWHRISEPGKTAESVHKDLVRCIGEAAGDLNAFQRHLRRLGIRFKAPGRPPHNSDKSPKQSRPMS